MSQYPTQPVYPQQQVAAPPPQVVPQQPGYAAPVQQVPQAPGYPTALGYAAAAPAPGYPPSQGYAPPVAPQPGYAPPPQQQAPGQPMAPQGMFTGVEGARTSMQAEYMKPGRYLVKINCCKVGVNWKHEQFSAIEGSVLCVLDNAMGQGHNMNEDVTDYTPRTSPYFLGDVKGFCAAMLGVVPEQVGEQHTNDIFGPQQPLTAACTVGEVEGRIIMTRENKPFTKVNWKRAVPAAELLLVLDAQTRERHFPNNILVQMATHDQTSGGQPVPPQDQWGSKAVAPPVPGLPQTVAPQQPQAPMVPPPMAPPPMAPAPAPQPGQPMAPAPMPPAPAPMAPQPMAAPATQQPQYRPAPAPGPAPAPMAPAPAPAPAAPPPLQQPGYAPPQR